MAELAPRIGKRVWRLRNITEALSSHGVLGGLFCVQSVESITWTLTHLWAILSRSQQIPGCRQYLPPRGESASGLHHLLPYPSYAVDVITVCVCTCLCVCVLQRPRSVGPRKTAEYNSRKVFLEITF